MSGRSRRGFDMPKMCQIENVIYDTGLIKGTFCYFSYILKMVK